MRNTTSRLTVWPLAALAIAFTLLGRSAAADTIAWWRFEPDDTGTPSVNEFLADSSGGNPLINSGAETDSDIAAGAAGSGSAYFNGAGIMQTVNTLDLSPYRHISLSWWMKVQSTALGLAWEHSTDLNSNPGAIVSSVHDSQAPSNHGLGAMRGLGCYYRDAYPHDDGSGDVWEQFTFQFNLDSPSTPEVVKVWRNGALVGTPSDLYTLVLPNSFVNKEFFIGARSGPKLGFVGKLDELKVATASEYVNLVGHNPNLVGYWRLGESAGSTAADVKGVNNGTYVNVSSGDFAQEGPILHDMDTAVDFNGSTSYVDCGTDASLSGSGWPGLTLAAWVKPDAAALSGYRAIVTKWDGRAPSQDDYWMALDNGKVSIALSDGAHEYGLTGNAALAADQWSFVAATWDNATDQYNIYINGVLDISAIDATVLELNASSDRPVVIGGQAYSTWDFRRYFPGAIDEVAIFNTALSETEILAMYHAAVPEPTSAVLLLVGLAVGTLSWRRRRLNG